MTELLFRDDAYLKTATARVLAADGGVVTLDRTIFYPQGGGQAGDTGFQIREIRAPDAGGRRPEGRAVRGGTARERLRGRRHDA